MASVSYQVNRGTLIDTLAAGSQTVSVGTAAPSSGDMEIRVDLTKNWTKNELRHAWDTIWRFIENSNNDTNFPL